MATPDLSEFEQISSTVSSQYRKCTVGEAMRLLDDENDRGAL
jgi:hypothetical protein